MAAMDVRKFNAPVGFISPPAATILPESKSFCLSSSFLFKSSALVAASAVKYSISACSSPLVTALFGVVKLGTVL